MKEPQVDDANLDHDWTSTQQKLVAGSIPAFEAFFARHPIETVRTIGYTWEWGQPTAAFYCVANTQTGLERALIDVNRYRPEPLNAAAALETVRWEAGYFPFPGGLVGPNDELGVEWDAEAEKLHAMTEAMIAVDHTDAAAYAQYSRKYETFLAALVTVCCQALAEIVAAGHLGEYRSIDFWVGSTDENGDIVKARDARIRQIISSTKS